MKKFIHRQAELEISKYRQIFPVIAILGPRQCGKSTLIKQLFSNNPNALYLDLQNTDDLNKLTEPRLFFQSNHNKIICLDEIQLVPNLFSVLRSVVDENRINGKFILLGSASQELVQKSTESLAGRIGFINLAPFNILEVQGYTENLLWIRGGFPDSFLAESDEFSTIWRENFIKTYIERDIPQLGYKIPFPHLKRFLIMCAHNHGQLLNLTKLGSSMDMTHPTIKKYIDIFEQTFILRSLKPYESNIKKRLVKSPKIYIRDTGLLHQLLSIKSMNDLFSHPIFGSSWEGYVIENVLQNSDNWNSYYFRTAKGDEIDLILENQRMLVAIECKASTSPNPSKGFWNALEIVKPKVSYIVAPIQGESYAIKEQVFVISLEELLLKLNELA